MISIKIYRLLDLFERYMTAELLRITCYEFIDIKNIYLIFSKQRFLLFLRKHTISQNIKLKQILLLD